MNIIGIDVGGTKILGILADAEGNIARELRVETRDDEGLEAVVDRIAGMARDLMPTDGDVEGVGVGIPGPLNPATGIVYNPPNLAGWETVPLRDMLRERLPGNEYEGVERTIDVHIRNLRRKIEADPATPRYIKTVFGVGYRCSTAEEV